MRRRDRLRRHVVVCPGSPEASGSVSGGRGGFAATASRLLCRLLVAAGGSSGAAALRSCECGGALALPRRSPANLRCGLWRHLRAVHWARYRASGLFSQFWRSRAHAMHRRHPRSRLRNACATRSLSADGGPASRSASTADRRSPPARSACPEPAGSPSRAPDGSRSATTRRPERTSSGRTDGVTCRTTRSSMAHGAAIDPSGAAQPASRATTAAARVEGAPALLGQAFDQHLVAGRGTSPRPRRASDVTPGSSIRHRKR